MTVGKPLTDGEAETEDLKEFFEERAAILEYDGGLPRPEAERLRTICGVACSLTAVLRSYTSSYSSPRALAVLKSSCSAPWMPSQFCAESTKLGSPASRVSTETR
jgi:hypothetical protein